MTFRSTVAGLAAGLALAACSSPATPAASSADAAGDVTPSDSSPSDASPKDASADTSSDSAATGQLSKDLASFCDPWVAWACQRALSCGCSTPKSGPLSAGVCSSAMKAICLDDFKKVSAGMAAGMIAIDPAKVPACIAWLDQQLPKCLVAGKKAMKPGPCTEWLVQVLSPAGECSGGMPCPDGSGCVDDKCGAVRQKAGAACTSNGQCQSQQCDSSLGKCSGYAAKGDSCETHATCPLLSPCIAGKCASLAKPGQACTSTDGCEMSLVCSGGKCATGPTSCDAKTDCGAGGACLGAVFNSCQAKLQEGQPCSQDAQCGGSTWCDQATQKCAKLPGSGQPCANGVLCGPGLACSADGGLCGPLPGDGKPCAMSEFGPMVCGPGLVCKTDAFVCGAPPTVGAPCNQHANCSPSAGKQTGDLVCAFGPTGSQCVQRQPAGSTCENDICQAGLFCDGKTNQCSPVVAAGGKCSAGNECGLQGSCVPDDQGSLRCVPLPKAGQACLMECADGLFCEKGLQNSTCQPPVCQLFYQLN